MRFYSRYNTHDHCGDDDAHCDPIIDDEQLPKFWDFLGKRYYFDDVDKTSTTTARYHLIKGGGDHVEHEKFQPSEGCKATDGGVCQMKTGDHSEKIGRDFTVLSWQDIFKNSAGCTTVIIVLVAIVACLILIDINRRRQHRQIRRSVERSRRQREERRQERARNRLPTYDEVMNKDLEDLPSYEEVVGVDLASSALPATPVSPDDPPTLDEAIAVGDTEELVGKNRLNNSWLQTGENTNH